MWERFSQSFECDTEWTFAFEVSSSVEIEAPEITIGFLPSKIPCSNPKTTWAVFRETLAVRCRLKSSGAVNDPFPLRKVSFDKFYQQQRFFYGKSRNQSFVEINCNHQRCEWRMHIKLEMRRDSERLLIKFEDGNWTLLFCRKKSDEMQNTKVHLALSVRGLNKLRLQRYFVHFDGISRTVSNENLKREREDDEQISRSKKKMKLCT